MMKRFPLVIATQYNIPMLLGNFKCHVVCQILFFLDCEGTGHQVEGEVYKIDQRMLEHLGSHCTLINIQHT